MKKLIVYLLPLFAFLSIQAQDNIMLIDSLFKTLSERGHFSGNALIVSNGKAIYQKSFGLADREQNTPNNENTLFNTGSVSMAMTAVAILQLSEKGMLDIDGFVADYLSGFPYKRITIGHLLTHASGLPEVDSLLPDWDNSKLISNNDVMEALYRQKRELAFDPGMSSMFNQAGYIILAEIVKIITRQEFHAYLENNVFKPAGMSMSHIYNGQEINEIEDAAKGYFFSPYTQMYEEALKSSDIGSLFPFTGTEGNSNVWSTTGDLLSFCQAISANAILKEETVSQMFLKKTDALMPGQTRSYGNSFSYGWIIPEAPFRIALARGSMPGFNTEIVWNLSEKRMIIFQSNDYLSFTSYNNLLPYSVGTILNQGVLNIPKRYASIELTNEVLHISNAQIREKIELFKSDPETYSFDVPGLEYLAKRLEEMGEVEKAELIKSLIKQE